MIESSSEFENVMIFKNQLITLDKKDLIDVYKDVSNYALFINVIIILINCENILFILDDNYIDKVYSILDIHRYDLNDNEVFNTANDIIDAMNKIKCIEEKEKYVEDYIKFQQKVRGYTFSTPDDLLYALSYDAVVVAGLRSKDVSIQYDDLFISSIRYFLEIYPEYFEDEEILMNTCNRLEEIKERKGFNNIITKQSAKKLIKRLNKMDLKEE